ncbi:A-kinase anchor protein 1, mitochondrial [Hyperolius riggenbachi]|uniref:A-kinase anchor protein 1, mitochondrial n=1 Tax=Hyperolius riggenbachi TaxID=752182 RepID=UPI0035A351CD
MGLHVRTIMPYALPGVLALLACWWFFSRKKDGRSKKHDHISACAGNEPTDSVLEELPGEEIHSSCRAQPVQLDREEEKVLQEDIVCTLPLGAQVTSLSKMQTCRKDDLQEFHMQSGIVGALQASPNLNFFESNNTECLREDEVIKVQEDGNYCTTSVIHFKLETNQAVTQNSDTDSKDIENKYSPVTELQCGCSQESDIQEFHTKATNQHSNDIHYFALPEMCSQIAAFEDTTEKKLPMEEQRILSHTNNIKAVDLSTSVETVPVEIALSSEKVEILSSDASERTGPLCHSDQSKLSSEVCDLAPVKPCLQAEEVETAQTEMISVISVKEKAQLLPDEIQVEDTVSQQPQCCQYVADEIGIVNKQDINLCDSQYSEYTKLEQATEIHSLDFKPHMTFKEVEGAIPQPADYIIAGEPSESCVKSSITQSARDSNCTDILNAFSKCLEKNEPLSSSGTVVDSLREANTKAFLGDYEAKIVEKLAINIISKVIAAATQEILSGSVTDASDSSCQALDESQGTLEKDAKSKHVLPDTDDYGSVSANLTVGLIHFDLTCESTQTDPSQTEDLSNVEMTSSTPFLEKSNDEHYIAPNESVHLLPSLSDYSPLHGRADFLEESQAALEDSSLSVCTSEEGISLDDPLQSTVLSTGGVGSYDSLSSSGIELSRETFHVSSDNAKDMLMESKNALYSNGDMKSGSPDLNSDGPLTAESDHSGGSDVNSMDSVDSGCALGNGEPFQNVKQKTDPKKSDLIIWEFEVPKYLVGRLIGKQGRFVSFLKQSSGAKIYISTVPYTQDIQICHLEGSQQQIDKALGLIRKKFKDLNLTNIFAPPPPLIPLPVASWLTLPNNVSVEVVVVNVVNAGHMFVQQRTHPTFHALCGLDQHMSLCYSQPGIPTLPTPAEVGILCAAPVGPNVWWRAQVMAYFEDIEEVEILYVDYGGYNRVKIETLRQIRSDFVSLPFQGVEVLLDNVVPLGDEDHFSAEADAAVKELTRGAPMLTQVTNYDEATRLPLVQLWRLNPDEMVSVNRTLVERGFAEWIESY